MCLHLPVALGGVALEGVVLEDVALEGVALDGVALRDTPPQLPLDDYPQYY